MNTILTKNGNTAGRSCSAATNDKAGIEKSNLSIKSTERTEISTLIKDYRGPFIENESGKTEINIQYFAQKIAEGYWTDGKRFYSKRDATEVIIEDIENELINVLQEEILSNAQKLQLRYNMIKEIMRWVRKRIERRSEVALGKYDIPVKNGILHYEGGEWKLEQSAKSFAISPLDVEYDPKASSTLFGETLGKIFPEESGKDKIDMLQQYLGSCLFFENPTQKFIYFFGVGGSGKSLLANVISRIVGWERSCDLKIDKGHSNYDNSQITEMHSLMVVTEANAGPFDGQLVKEFTGGDNIEIRKKHSNETVARKGSFSLICTSNFDPVFIYEGTGEEWKRRLIPIKFEHSIPDEEKDFKLLDKLFEDGGSGILNWLLVGAAKVVVQDGKIFLPASIEKVRDDLISRSHPVELFVKHCIYQPEHPEKCRFKSSDAYDAYCQFAQCNELTPIEENPFYKKLYAVLAEKFPTCKKAKDIRFADGTRASGYYYLSLRYETGE